MSAIHFIKSPFPDNHNGFDYTPKSFTDVQREYSQQVNDAENKKAETKLLSMLESVFK